MNKDLKKYSAIYEPLYKKGYHGKMNFTHSESLIAKVKEYLPEGSKLLDIGCSNGTCVKMLQEAKYDSYGIDISETAISMAGERGSRNCILGSATKIPFYDNDFDGILCSDVLEHIFEEDVPKAVSEIYRVAKKYVFLKVSMAKEKNTGWVKIYNSQSDDKIDNLHVSVLPLEVWEDHFRTAGFKLNKAEMINKNCFEIVLEKCL